MEFLIGLYVLLCLLLIINKASKRWPKPKANHIPPDSVVPKAIHRYNHISPRYYGYDGGFSNITKCVNCGRIGLYWDQHTTNPCNKCGHKVKECGAGKWTLNEETNEMYWARPEESKPEEKKSRCCGRCDGVNDLCVADMVCDKHDNMGCEICYGEK